MSESKCSIESFLISDMNQSQRDCSNQDGVINAQSSHIHLTVCKKVTITSPEIELDTKKVTITGELQVNGNIHSDKKITDELGNSNHHKH